MLTHRIELMVVQGILGKLILVVDIIIDQSNRGCLTSAKFTQIKFRSIQFFFEPRCSLLLLILMLLGKLTQISLYLPTCIQFSSVQFSSVQIGSVQVILAPAAAAAAVLLPAVIIDVIG